MKYDVKYPPKIPFLCVVVNVFTPLCLQATQGLCVRQKSTSVHLTPATTGASARTWLTATPAAVSTVSLSSS